MHVKEIQKQLMNEPAEPALIYHAPLNGYSNMYFAMKHIPNAVFPLTLKVFIQRTIPYEYVRAYGDTNVIIVMCCRVYSSVIF